MKYSLLFFILIAGMQLKPGEVFAQKDKKCFDLFVPNNFTPAGEKDTCWSIRYEGPEVTSFEVSVYNRWGEVVFESKNISFSWNGKSKNGTPMPADAYMYTLTIQPSGCDPGKYSGYISLIR